MNKPIRNFLLVLTLILSASLLLLSCNPAAGKPSASSTSAPASTNPVASDLGGPARGQRFG